MLSRRVGTPFEGALLCITTLSFEKEFFTLSPAQLARRS
jgi:hypothetical protein